MATEQQHWRPANPGEPIQFVDAKGRAYTAGVARETATAAFVLGVIGVALGLIPLFAYFAIIVSVIGLILSIVNRGKRLWRSALVLNFVGVGLSIIGFVILANAFD